MREYLKVPESDPEKILRLRDSSFAADLFITAVSYLDLFSWLEAKPSDFETICGNFKIASRPADVMLTLFKSYGFIEEKKHIFYNTGISMDYLCRSSFWNLGPYVESLKDRPISLDMIKVLKTGKPAGWGAKKDGKDWSSAMNDEKFAGEFTAGMNSRGAYLAAGLAQKLDLSGYSRILDIGGASGIYSIILADKNPGLSGSIFEKKPVDIAARYTIEKFGLSGRINIVSGDMFEDEFPKDYDVHFISHVLHDWDNEAVKKLLRKSYNSLKPGGIIVIHDAHINKKKTGPVSVAEYSALLMFSTEGKCYSVSELFAFLKETGFKDLKYLPAALNRSVITGKKY